MIPADLSPIFLAFTMIGLGFALLLWMELIGLDEIDRRCVRIGECKQIELSYFDADNCWEPFLFEVGGID